MKRQQMLAVIFLLVAVGAWWQQDASRKAAKQAEQAAASAAPVATPSPVKLGPGPRDFLVATVNLIPSETSHVATSAVEVRTIAESVPLPDETVAVRSWEQIKDLELTSSITAGEIVLKTRFGQARGRDVQRKLRDVIPMNYRAITLDVDAVTGITGFINQGDIVDVVATYTSGNRQVTRIILQNVEILAKGAEYRMSTRPTAERIVRGETGGGITFTLKVTPQMATRLAHIIDERGANRFRLIMKNRDDKQEFRTAGVLLRELITDQKRPVMSKELSEAEEVQEIEVLRGAGASKELGNELVEGPPGAATVQQQAAASSKEATEKGEAPSAEVRRP